MIYKLANVKKEPPQIVDLSEAINMIGVSVRTTPRTILRDSQQVGLRYKKIKDAGSIPNKRSPWAFVAVSKNFGPGDSWDYLLGDVVTTLDLIPQGLEGFIIPPGKYAKFCLQPRALFLWGLAMGLMKKYIYSEWLPGSKYESDNTIVGDFEYHDQRSLTKKAEIDIYVAIKEKQP